jgi:hypothetical protein
MEMVVNYSNEGAQVRFLNDRGWELVGEATRKTLTTTYMLQK